MVNNSGRPMKINWDDISYADTRGNVGRVMHAGVKYIDRNSSQPATTIPQGKSLSDILIPTNNVHWQQGNSLVAGGWVKDYLIPCVYKNKEAFRQYAHENVGKTLTIMMPLVIDGVQNDYVFTFNIEKLL